MSNKELKCGKCTRPDLDCPCEAKYYTASCFSCDADFELKGRNEKEQGYFCDKCLENHMDEFTKRKVRQAMRDNPDLPVKFVIAAIRDKQVGFSNVHINSPKRI